MLVIWLVIDTDLSLLLTQCHNLLFIKYLYSNSRMALELEA